MKRLLLTFFLPLSGMENPPKSIITQQLVKDVVNYYYHNHLFKRKERNYLIKKSYMISLKLSELDNVDFINRVMRRLLFKPTDLDYIVTLEKLRGAVKCIAKEEEE